MSAVTVRVPASAANLGPGYDSFGLALGLHQTFTARAADKWSVEVHGEGEGRFSRDGRNRVAKAMAEVFARVEGAPPAAHLVCENRIPSARGLGSSAAAIIGGVLLADALCGSTLTTDELFRIAAGLEGHPDNVAAAMYGGFTIAWIDDGSPHAVALEPACGIAGIAVVSSGRLATHAARKLLPKHVPHADAAFNSARSGLLAAGMALGRKDMIAAGLEDRIHQPYRASAIQDLGQVIEALIEAGAAGAVLSGAGPTVIGLVCANDDAAALDEAAKVVGRLGAFPEGRSTPLILPIDRQGTDFL